MELSILIWLLFFSVVAYLAFTEPNFYEATDLLFKSLVVEIRRRWLMLIYHPKNPLTNYLMEVRIRKMTRDLRDELGLPDIEDENDGALHRS